MINDGKKKTARVNDYATADVKASLTRLPGKPKAAVNHGRISSLPVIKARTGGRSQTIVRNRFGGNSRNLAVVEDNPFTTTNQHHFEEL